MMGFQTHNERGLGAHSLHLPALSSPTIISSDWCTQFFFFEQDTLYSDSVGQECLMVNCATNGQWATMPLACSLAFQCWACFCGLM